LYRGNPTNRNMAMVLDVVAGTGKLLKQPKLMQVGAICTRAAPKCVCAAAQLIQNSTMQHGPRSGSSVYRLKGSNAVFSSSSSSESDKPPPPPSHKRRRIKANADAAAAAAVAADLPRAAAPPRGATPAPDGNVSDVSGHSGRSAVDPAVDSLKMRRLHVNYQGRASEDDTPYQHIHFACACEECSPYPHIHLAVLRM
jgi:hypothetical protein